MTSKGLPDESLVRAGQVGPHSTVLNVVDAAIRRSSSDVGT